jgi:hypothetical protein
VLLHECDAVYLKYPKTWVAEDWALLHDSLPAHWSLLLQQHLTICSIVWHCPDLVHVIFTSFCWWAGWRTVLQGCSRYLGGFEDHVVTFRNVSNNYVDAPICVYLLCLMVSKCHGIWCMPLVPEFSEATMFINLKFIHLYWLFITINKLTRPSGLW